MIGIYLGKLLSSLTRRVGWWVKRIRDEEREVARHARRGRFHFCREQKWMKSQEHSFIYAPYAFLVWGKTVTIGAIN